MEGSVLKVLCVYTTCGLWIYLRISIVQHRPPEDYASCVLTLPPAKICLIFNQHMFKTSLLWLSLLLVTLSAPNERQIRSKSILLPITQSPTDHKIQYVTQAYGGCYHWSTNQPQVLTVQGLTTDGCQSKAIVKLTHQGPFLSPLSISAKDKHSDEVVKAFVRLAKISTIDIVTKFRVMNVNQIVEFYITAYDSEHNTFSSLKGFKFQWSIVQDGQIVERVGIKDSGIHQETSYRRELEALGYQTDMMVLKANRIGQLKLRAKLKEPRYQGIQAEIRVSVQERFDIEPASPVYLLANSRFKFNLLNSKFQQIKLPNSIYKQTLSNPSYTLTSTLQLLTPPSIDSQTLLTVQDDRTSPAYKNQVQIFSYTPDQMIIRTKDYIVTGQQQLYTVQFYRNKRLLKGIVDYEIVSRDVMLNKDRLTMTGREKTVALILARYGGLSAEKTVVVNLPVRVVLVENRLVLPVGQTFQMNVVGGSGEFRYAVEPSGLADVGMSGALVARMKGNGVVTVTDRKDPRNSVQVVLSVEPVKLVRSFEERMEVPVGGESEIIAIAEPLESKAFTQCNDLQINIDHTINNNVKQVKVNRDYAGIVSQLKNQANSNTQLKLLLQKTGKPSTSFDAVKQFGRYIQSNQITSQKLSQIISSLNNHGICLGLKTLGVSPRQTPTRLLLNNSTSTSPQFTTKVFQPLTSLDVPLSDILLTPLSMFNWKSKGGPSKWQLQPVVYLNGERTRNGVWIECGDKVETKQYRLAVVNTPTSRLPRPYVSTVNLTVHCRYPTEVRIEAAERSLDKKHLYLTRQEPFVLAVAGYDRDGRRFTNNSNLEYSWELNGVKKGSAVSKPNYQFEIIPGAPRHSLRVHTDHILHHPSLSFPPLTDQLQLLLKPPFTLTTNNRPTPTQFTLILHPFNKQTITLKQGSGTYAILCISQVVRCSYSELDHRIDIVPVKVGEAMVKVSDVMVYGRDEKVVKVYVVEPQRMVLTANATLLEEGRWTKVEANVYGQGNRLVQATQFKYFTSKITTDCVVKETDRTLNTVTYQVTQKGSCSVYGYIDGLSPSTSPSTPNRLQSQNTLHLQIYPPFSANLLSLTQTLHHGLTHHSGNLNIALGCNSFLTFSGGPDHKLDIKYSCQPDNIVHVNHIDDRTYEFRSIKEGETVFRLGLMEEGVLISETVIRILVKRISGVQIVGVTNGRREVHKGAMIRLVPKIMIEDDKVADSFCQLSYEWRTEDKEIVELGQWASTDQRFVNSGINVTGKQKGVALVELVVKQQGKQIARTKSLLKILQPTQLSPPTYITTPNQPTNYLLLPPKSTYSFALDQRPRLLSPCDKTLEVDQNTVTTFDERKAIGLQVSSLNSDEAVNYLTVVVTKIHSVVIENPTGLLNMQVDSKAVVRFYVQDVYGRVFPNRVEGVGYVVRVSNPAILSAQLSQDKSSIQLLAHSNGSCQLLLTIDNTQAYDIVPVRIGNLIHPSSPVYIHEGGIIHFRSQQGKGEWQSSSPSVVSIDEETGVALAQKQGVVEVVFRAGVAFRSRVSVFQVTNIQEVVVAGGKGRELDYTHVKQANLQDVFWQFRTYRLIWRAPGPVELTQNLNKHTSAINHNLLFKCQTKNPQWFQVIGGISDGPNNTQTPFCMIRPRKIHPDSKIPSSLILTTTLSSNRSSYRLSQVFTYPFHFQFLIPDHDKTLDLNPQYPSHNITIKTNEQLIVDSREWLSTHFSSQLRQQTIRVDFEDSKSFLKTTVRVKNLITGQVESIGVRYDPNGRGQMSGGGAQGSWFRKPMKWSDYIVGALLVVMVLLFLNRQVDNKPKMF